VKLKLELEHGGNLIHQDEVQFTVFDVEQVVWESVHSPLEPNPSPPAPGRGNRIFPDWQSPTPPRRWLAKPSGRFANI